jgi:signal transduction histidine kinase
MLPLCMLDRFIVANREAIIAGAGARRSPTSKDAEPTSGIPVFLDQLVDVLRLANSSAVVDQAALIDSAGKYGCDLLARGLTIGQLVHDYGDVSRSITQRAGELGVPISADELRILNWCVDGAIAGAVTEYARQRERTIEDHGTERLGVLVHELRNVLSTVSLAYASILSGRVPVGGSTGQLLGTNLVKLERLIDSSLAVVRRDAGIARFEQIPVAGFVEEIEMAASPQAEARGIRLTVPAVLGIATIEGDRQILSAAIANMLQNAFKFTRRGGAVSLTTRIADERILFDIEDECGGLPPGKIEELFTPFSQRSTDRSGLGLGLAICLRAARASGGEIRVRDIPGRGCVFTLDLPRRSLPPPSAIGGGQGRGGPLH